MRIYPEESFPSVWTFFGSNEAASVAQAACVHQDCYRVSRLPSLLLSLHASLCPRRSTAFSNIVTPVEHKFILAEAVILQELLVLLDSFGNKVGAAHL